MFFVQFVVIGHFLGTYLFYIHLAYDHLKLYFSVLIIILEYVICYEKCTQFKGLFSHAVFQMNLTLNGENP